jgi:aspartyl-tRNA(Asn)/glutamyl-tRNA(Gln) amidotransferase subunit C
MLDVNQELLDYLSDLSRIGLKESEKEKILGDLKTILTYFEELKDVETDNVEPTYTIFADLATPQREDTVGETLPRDQFLKNAPSSLGGMVTIPSLFN